VEAGPVRKLQLVTALFLEVLCNSHFSATIKGESKKIKFIMQPYILILLLRLSIGRQDNIVYSINSSRICNFWNLVLNLQALNLKLVIKKICALSIEITFDVGLQTV